MLIASLFLQLQSSSAELHVLLINADILRKVLARSNWVPVVDIKTCLHGMPVLFGEVGALC